jgi:hypothetical protein
VVDDELVKPTPTYPTIRLESSLPPHTKKKKKKKKYIIKFDYLVVNMLKIKQTVMPTIPH